MAGATFHWADYLVTVLMLLVSLGIGFFFALFRGGQKTKAEYLLGNRQMSLGPVCLSLFVTFQSAISLIGTPADVYNTGTLAGCLGAGISLAYVIGYFTVVPVMYPLHLTSVYEYLELRFRSRAVRLLGTGLGMFQTMLYMAVALYSPALALQAAAGIQLWMSLAIVGGIGTIYTAVGGIKSVVWTDAFQTVIVFIGIATVLIKGLRKVGGFSAMIDMAEHGSRIFFAEVTPDPRERHTVWGCLIGASIMWMVNCFNQSSVQRIGSLRTMRSAKIAFLLNVPLNLTYSALLTLMGLLLYAYVVTIRCDPFQAGLIDNKNQMMPYFVIHVLDDLPGFAGLYMSMLFSGALSTVSSGINALAANSVEDVLARPLRGLRDTTVTIIAKILVVFYGGVTIGMAYGMKMLSGPVTQLAVTAFGACGGPIVGIFMLGGAFPRANKYGAILGGLAGLAVNLWLGIGAQLYGRPTPSLTPGPIDNCGDALFRDNYTATTNTMEMGASLTYSTLPYSLQAVGGEVGVGAVGGGGVVDPPTSGSVPTESLFGVLNGTTELPGDAADEGSFSIYDVSYVWLGAAGLLSSFVTGVLVSLLTGSQDVDTLDVRLIFPFLRKVYGLRDPVPRPEDTSNVIAMKNYREAWETFKRSSVSVDVDPDPSVMDPLHPVELTPHHLTFHPPKPSPQGNGF
ncbi:sodium-coupled monocarboxylate transporter 1-like [Babylonia areolata]|uniref:sodium-coupled monocarboxylate transporter 1-like n=1 Tax=Babylonia areolata TaxID=304850 RepID=UPI003FD251F2